MQDFFVGASEVKALKAPASVTADGYTAGFDIRPYDGAVAVVLAALNTAGTTPTMDIKLQSAPEGDLTGDITYSGTGTGKLTDIQCGADTVEETITVAFSSATAFTVTGSVTGSMGSGTVGTRFATAQISFLAVAGGTAFVNADAFTIPVSARTYTDIAGAAFTRVTTVAGFQKLKVESDQVGAFIRAALDIGGTNSPAYTIGLALLAMKAST